MSTNPSDFILPPSVRNSAISAGRPPPFYRLFDRLNSLVTRSGADGIAGMLLACALSLVFANCLFPTGTMLGTSYFWQNQTGDITQYIAGFNAYVREPWHWPLLRIDSLNWPGGTLATFVDAIPLYAFILKLCSHGSDTPFRNPYGAWVALCYAMQGVASWWICREARTRSWSTLAAMTVLLAAFPALIARIGHISLMSHWLILFGIAIYLRSTRQGKLAAIPWACLVFCAFYINVYIFCMVSLIYCADWLRDFGRGQWRYTMAAPIIAFGLLGLSLFITMLPLQLASIAPEWGFGYYSMNMLSPIAGGKLMPWLPGVANDGQNEGFNYIGVVVIALCIYVIGSRLRSDGRFLRRHFPLLLVALVFTLYAFSNIIYFGKVKFLYLEMPLWSIPFTSQLRASGRFFWPVGYLVTVFAILMAHRQLTPSIRPWIMAVLVLLHLWDIQPVAEHAAAFMNAPEAEPLDEATLNKFLGKRTSILYFYPPFRCGTKPQNDSLLPAMLYAARQELKLTTGYVARSAKSCDHYQAEIDGAPIGGTAFIFSKAEFGDRRVIEKMMGNKAPATCLDTGLTYVCKATGL